MKLRAIAAPGALAMIVLLFAGSCAYPIAKQLRAQAQKENLTFARVLENPEAFKGGIVLWGGKIIETKNHEQGSELIMLQTPLDFWGMPKAARTSQGRFIIQSSRFFDPQIYTADKKITLAGEVLGAQERALGKTTYTYPVVRIREIHFWESSDYPDSSVYYWQGFGQSLH